MNIDFLNRSNAAGSSHRPSSANAGGRQRIFSLLCCGAAAASPRLQAVAQSPEDGQDHIRQLQPRGASAGRRHLRRMMKQSLNTWAQNGLPDENRSAAVRKILQAFQTNSSRLDLSGQGLWSLPREIGNLTRLTVLYLSGNHLTQLPESFCNLVGLTHLYLDNNHLLRLPASFGNLTRLRFLYMDRNLLTDLPASFGNLTGLRDVTLGNNLLESVPQIIFRFSSTTRINLAGNRLPQQAVVELSQRSSRGPRTNFSIFEAAAGRQQEASLGSVVRRYCSQIAPDQLANLQDTEKADFFRQLLTRLANTAEARYPWFKARVAAVVETLAEAGSAELRAKCFFQAQEGLDTCRDQVAITFSEIEVACKVHQIIRAGDGPEQMAGLLKALFRMDALNKFARTDINRRQGGVDETEVFLAYRVGLKDELDLLYETDAMHYQAMSGVDRQKLDHAKAHVLAAENAGNGANLVEFAFTQPFWKEYIESNPSYISDYKEKEAALEQEQGLKDKLEKLADKVIKIRGKTSDPENAAKSTYIAGEYAKIAKQKDAIAYNCFEKVTREILFGVKGKPGAARKART